MAQAAKGEAKMSNLIHVRMFNAALDDATDSPAGIVLRGAIDLRTLHLLKTDTYQREALPLSSQKRIMSALESGARLPDLDLGMRGSNFSSKTNEFVLKDPVYIIDGLQRQSTIIYWLQTHVEAVENLRIGATVHFNTTREWERTRFHKLNNWRNRLGPNVLLRNLREDTAYGPHGHPVLIMLHALTHNEKGFVLCGRTTWQHRAMKSDIISAMTLMRVAGRLHAHKGPCGGGSLDEMVTAALKTGTNVGISNMRENLRTFFNMVDTCWGIRSVAIKEGASYMKLAFLLVLSKLLSDHHDFWLDDEERKLFVHAPLVRKIASFPLHDPEIRHMCSASGKSREHLYLLLRDHINSGKRTKKLRPRSESLVVFDTEAEEMTSNDDDDDTVTLAASPA
jgi:hypothetical protein